MHIILWRHVEAEAGFDDLARRLTDKGRKQARCGASWLKRRLPPGYRLWISEAVRSRETVEYLRGADRPYSSVVATVMSSKRLTE